MEIKYKHKGIVARPGVHMRGDIPEAITSEQLRMAIAFQPRIPLIVGPHPPGGRANPNDYIGYVEQTWNEAQQRVDGKFLFYKECWNRIPVDVQRRLNNEEIVRLSAGYEIGEVIDGAQRGRRYDHLALDVPNPMHKDVGVNVRMEAELPENFRIEQESQIGEAKKEESIPEAKDEAGPSPSVTFITFTEDQFAQFIDAFKPTSAPPAVSETEVVEPPVEAPEAEPEVIEEPKVEPEVVVPASKGADPERLEDGGIGVNIFEKKNK